MKNIKRKKNSRLMDVNDVSGKTESSLSPSLCTRSQHTLNNMDISQPVLNKRRDICDPVQYLDIEQRNPTMALKIIEYENAFSKRDYTIKSLHTDMMNSQNNNHVFANHYKNIMEKEKLLSDSSNRLNINFTNILERLNRLENIAENVRTRQKEVANTVEQTTNAFKEKMLSNIDNSLKDLNLYKIKAKQELEVLENRYHHQIDFYKINLEKSTKELNNLRSEQYCLLEKINEENIKLKEEKEVALSHNCNFEKQLNEMKSQNALLSDKYKSINVKYEEMLDENQSLKDDLIITKTSLDENTKKLSIQLNKIKEQTELLNNLKVTEDMNDLLKIGNCTLKECNRNLEKTNSDLIDSINSNKIYQYKSEKLQTKFEDLCTTYDNLMKMQENNLTDAIKKLELQKRNKDDAQIKIIGLQKEIEMCTKTTVNLQDKLNASDISISNLQSTIETLKTNLANTCQKLQNSAKEYAIEKSELEKGKTVLENETRNYIEEIKKLTPKYMKYKSKASRMSENVMKLRDQCLRSESQKTDCPNTDIIELISDDEEAIIVVDHDDVSILEFRDRNVSKINTSLQSTSNTVNQGSEYTRSKRLSSPLKNVNNIKRKKQRTAVDIDASKSKANRKSEKVMKLRDQCSQSEFKENDNSNIEIIELISDDEEAIIVVNHSTSNTVNQSFEYTSSKRLSSPLKNISNIKRKNQIAAVDASKLISDDDAKNHENIESNQSVLNISHLTLSPQNESNNENKDNKVQSIPYTDTHIADNKKIFKIPDFLKPSQKCKKSKNSTR